MADRKALLNNEDIKFKVTRHPKISNGYLLRIIALKDVKGDINLGMVVDAQKNSCIPLPIIEKHEKNKNLKWEKNIIKDFELSQNDFYDCEIVLPKSAEFAISTI